MKSAYITKNTSLFVLLKYPSEEYNQYMKLNILSCLFSQKAPRRGHVRISWAQHENNYLGQFFSVFLGLMHPWIDVGNSSQNASS